MVQELATGIGVGRGAVMDATNEFMFSDYADFTLSIPIEILEVGVGQTVGNKVRIPIGQEFLGTVACHSVNARMLAALIGGTTATSASRPYFTEREKLTKVANAITLSNAPIETGTLEVINGDGDRYDQVGVGTEVAGESYSIAAAVCTFNVAETYEVFYPSYYYDLVAVGTTVTPSPGSLPSKFKLYGHITFEGRSDTPNQMGFVAKKAMRTGEIKLGAAENGHEPVSFDVAFENFFDDDVVFYFPLAWV